MTYILGTIIAIVFLYAFYHDIKLIINGETRIGRKKKNNCKYCIDSYIICYHDSNHNKKHIAKYCPMCGKKF